MKKQTQLPDFALEKQYWNTGNTVIGIDEVGRGCIAGPIVLGAVCLKPLDTETQGHLLSLGINDSKKLSISKRLKIVEAVNVMPIIAHTVSVSVPTINSIGIMNAWRLAAGKILSLCRLDYPNDTFTLLVDGQAVKEIPYKEEVTSVYVVKGDSKSVAIASASVIAKVARDTFMSGLSKQYPKYEWEKNKGYGTAAHCDALKKHGVTPWHRQLFVRSILGSNT